MDKTAEVTGELMEWLKTSAEKGGDFLAEQAPLYAQEVVAWAFLSNIIGVVLLPIGIVVLAFVARALIKKCSEDKTPYGPEPILLIAAIIATILPAILVVPLIFAVCGAVKAKVAPRMVIIEHVRGLAK